jgi:porin
MNHMPTPRHEYGLPNIWLLQVVLLTLAATNPARAQPVEVPPTWGGDFESRPRLTGDWDGVRDELGKKGVVFDLDALLTPQGVVSGGRSSDTDLWGNLEYTLNIDTQKAGWWPGGFLKVEGITGFGNNVLYNSGAVVPVNTAALFPGINQQTTALTNATFMQFLSPKLGLMVGKFNTVDLGEGEFYGNYHTQFLNAAFVFPMTLLQVPLAAWGAGIIAMPSKELTLSALVLNPDGTPDTNPVFNDGVEIFASGQLTVKPFGLVGHQSISYSWNDKTRYSLQQDPTNILGLLLTSPYPRLANVQQTLTPILQQEYPGLLIPTVPPNTEASSWAFSYSFDQYFWQPENKPKQGVGLFFAFGASDGNPNPLKYSFLAGVGGKGVPGRAEDSYGLGFAKTQFSSAFVPFLRERLDLGLGRENAFEAYYNLALAGSINLTADVQVVNPGLQKTLVDRQLANVNTAVILGLRLRVRL